VATIRSSFGATLGLALLAATLVNCSNASDKREIESLRQEVAALRSTTVAATPEQPIVVNKDATPNLAKSIDTVPYCITYRVAGVTQTSCKDIWIDFPDRVLPAQLRVQSAAVGECWGRARTGDVLPEGWR